MNCNDSRCLQCEQLLVHVFKSGSISRRLFLFLLLHPDDGAARGQSHRLFRRQRYQTSFSSSIGSGGGGGVEGQHLFHGDELIIASRDKRFVEINWRRLKSRSPAATAAASL